MFFNKSAADETQPSALQGLFNMLGITQEQQDQFADAGKKVFDRFVGIDSQVHQNALHLARIEAKIDALDASLKILLAVAESMKQPTE